MTFSPFSDFDGSLGGVRTNASVLRIGGPVMGDRGSDQVALVIMDTIGDEVALSFSLHYDPTRLTNPRVSLGGVAQSYGMVLTLTDNPGNGRIGVLMDSHMPLPKGSIEILRITFSVPANAPAGIAGLNFANEPLPRSTSDGLANLVPTVYVNGYSAVLDHPGDRFTVSVPAPVSSPVYIGPWVRGTEPPQTYVAPAVKSADGSAPTIYTQAKDPIIQQVVNNTIDDHGTISSGIVTQGPFGPVISINGVPVVAEDGKIFGLSPLVLLGIAAGGIFLMSSGK